jgi:ectoine hydroxylase-related dioxygenase (phytanoyl-CoA dioxygenase family)
MAVTTEAILSQEQREKFERDGYLIVESPGWPESVIDGVLADVEGKFEGGPEGVERDRVYYFSHRIMDAWRMSENARTIAVHPRLLQILEELYGRKPLPFQTLNFQRGTQQLAHSDAVHFNTMPPGYMAGVWVALEDIDMDNGPLVYYPGSQKRPFLHPKDIGAEPKEEEYPKYTEYVQNVIAEEGLEPEYGLIKKGDALIWSANLLHGGAKQNDMTRSRNSQVTHYFFEGCKYYTPWMSDPDTDKIFWRNPEWIS